MQSSVEIVDPTVPVTLSDTAKTHLRLQIQTAAAHGIRLRVKESGCTGYMYVLDLVAQPDVKDVVLPLGDAATLFLDSGSLPILRGTHIDFVREGLNSVLRFSNPNAKDHCGCGESFNIEEAAE